MQWQPKVIYITLSILPALLLVRALWQAYRSEATLKRKFKSLLEILFLFSLLGVILFSFPVSCIVVAVNYVNWDGNNLVKTVTRFDEVMRTEHYSILNGEYHGHYQEKDASGLLTIDGQYENGLKAGEWREWHPSGQLRSQEFYKNGEEHGASTSWHENGHKSERVTLSDGEYLNDYIAWHPNAQMSQQGFSSKSGVCKKWYDNGQIAEVKEYDGRRLVSAEVYLPDGKECPYTNFMNGTGSVADWLSWDNIFNGEELPEKIEFYENGTRVKSTNNY
jgi:antitoxin component YwqK of YwqJK toxin-antitoxin module